MHKSKKIALFGGIVLLIFILSLTLIYLFYVSNQLKNNKKSPVSKEIVDNLKNNELSFDIFSWNSSLGRIYAEHCSGGPYDLDKFEQKHNLDLSNSNYLDCLDGGTYYYDYSGKEITNCGGMPSSIRSALNIDCFLLQRLKAVDADYYYYDGIESDNIKK